MITRLSLLSAALGLALLLATSTAPAAPQIGNAIAAELVIPTTPLVPNPVTIVNNNDDSEQGFRYHYPTSSSTALNCAGSYKVLAVGTSSQAWVSDVNSMRFYRDARVTVRHKSTGAVIKIWGINVPSGSSVCYKTMSNDRIYDVLVADGANVGADQYQ